MTDAAIMVHLQAVDKGYLEGRGERPVLSGLTLSINRGELVAIVGPSGTGKSTLLNLIAGLDLPDGGEVMVGGNPVFALDERSRTLTEDETLDSFSQSFNLVPTLTVLENVLLPMELNGRVDHEKALSLLARVGLEDRHGSFPDKLSGGEQQRVAIARALSHDPLLVLADEPTGNLDVKTAKKVMDVLITQVVDHAKTLLVVTHSPVLASRADRILRMDDGQIREAHQ